MKYSKFFRIIKLFLFFVLGGFVGVIFLGILSISAILWLKNEYKLKAYPNISYSSIPVTGKTETELKEMFTEINQKISARKITFTWKNNVEKRWEIIPLMIDFNLDTETAIKEIMSTGRSENKLFSFLEIYRLILSPKNVQPKFVYNQQQLTSIIAKISQEVDRPAQDALFEFKLGKVTNFQDSKEGFLTNKEKVEDLILATFKQTPFDDNQIEMALPIDNAFPKVATSETNRLGIKELIAEGESFFSDSIPTRVFNIILASSYFHGVVVAPDEIFSFGEKIGTISAETGYKKAYVIKDNKTMLEDGGGVCQVSTTLFRAALNAGLPIVERQAHYYRVGFYEQGGYPPGLDATVYPPSPDFKFKNDTSAYLLIQTEISQNLKRLTFKIYGTKDGRKVEMTKPKITSQTPPPDPIYSDDPTLPVGVTKKFDSAHWGAKVSFTRKVFNLDGSLKEEKTFLSNYKAWPAVYLRGTKI